MKRSTSTIAITALLLASCGGGGGSNAGPTPGPPPATPVRLFQDPAAIALTSAEVQQIVAQGVAEAQARGLPGTIVVVDRVGNVLAAFRMTGANDALNVPSSPSGVNHDLQGFSVPNGAVAGAIAKAITGAYLSSSGNAFSTRTASQIVQEHFPPSAAARGLESGPLFGVQFSQLPCSDLAARFGALPPAAALIGPKRSPLGLSADPGGFPLYKSGVVVGGVGFMGDGIYGFDPEIQDVDSDAEEAIALAATQGFAAAVDIQADRVTVDGTSLRFSDATLADLRTSGPPPPLVPASGALIAVNGYYAGLAFLAGTPYGSEASGIRLANGGEFANPDAYVLTDGSGNNRYPIVAGTDPGGSALSAAEVRAILEEAFKVMSAARAQIRRPLDSRAQVSISVVDLNGRVLGIVRSPDAPIFGTDVSLQKARTAAFFSSATAGAELSGNLTSADVRAYVPAARAFFNDPAALTGRFAFSDRAIGNVSRPYFPDGELGRPPGAFSRPIAEFNPFSTGLQSALIVANIAQHVMFIRGLTLVDTPATCTGNPNPQRLANGIQIFPGSVPIYRGNTLVGGIGVSGDGIDQDDMISFLGLHNGGVRLGTVGNAPTGIRSDQIVVPVAGASGGGVRLRWVNCPFNPFLGTNEQNVCQGK